MSTRPWMPLYVADYLADTAHLGALESGAYLHLIMHYWQTGGLPSDPRELARIARCSARQWTKIGPVMKPFFHDGWLHKRIDKELLNVSKVSEKRRYAAKIRHQQNDAHAPANALQMHTHSHSHSHSDKKEEDIGTRARASEVPEPVGRHRISDVHAEFLKVVGVEPDDPRLFGSHHQIAALIARGFSRETILAGAARAIAGKSKIPTWPYFAKVIETENAERSAPARTEVPHAKVATNGPTGRSGLAAIRKMREQIESQRGVGGEATGSAVFRLPKS